MIKEQIEKLKSLHFDDGFTSSDLNLIPSIPRKIVRLVMNNGEMTEDSIITLFLYEIDKIQNILQILCEKDVLVCTRINDTQKIYRVNFKKKPKNKISKNKLEKLDQASNKSKLDNLYKQVIRITQDVIKGEHGNVDEILNLLDHNKYPTLIKKMIESFLAMIMKTESREYHLKYNNLSQLGIDTNFSENENITSFGNTLEEVKENLFSIDLSQFIILTGYNRIVNNIIDRISEQYQQNISEIVVHYEIISEISEELLNINIKSITFYGRAIILKNFEFIKHKLYNQIENVLFSLQNPRWRKILFKTKTTEIHETSQNISLLFPFCLYSKDSQITDLLIVEYIPKNKSLSITIDDCQVSRFNYDHIPHRIVGDLSKRLPVTDIDETTEIIYSNLKNEIEKNNYEFIENINSNPLLLRKLGSFYKDKLSDIYATWNALFKNIFNKSKKKIIKHYLAKIIYLINEKEIIHHLNKGNTLELKDPEYCTYIDLSRNGKCLNLSFGKLRTKPTIDFHLSRMKNLKEFSDNNKETFHNTRIFLIHHCTSDVLGCLKAIENMECSYLHTFFIKYAGSIPGKYLEVLLSLPKNKFQFHTLDHIKTNHNVDGYYAISKDFSDIKDYSYLNSLLHDNKLDFLNAYRLTAGNMFIQEAIKSIIKKQKLLLIEDGGYLSPLLNIFCKKEKTLADVLEYFGFPLNFENTDSENNRLQYYQKMNKIIEKLPDKDDLNSPFQDWLNSFFIGSVENSKNGYEYNKKVEDSFHGLAFPTVTTATSKLKNGLEAEETAISIIHSIETVLQGLGLVISKRNAIVLGGLGAIGSKAIKYLSYKLGKENIFNVDIAINNLQHNKQAKTILDIPKEFLYNTDLFLGFTGKSVINKDIFEEIILNSNRENLLFVSGSTKTAEFTDIFQYLNQLIIAKEPNIKSQKIKLDFSLLKNPLSSYIEGTKVNIVFVDNNLRNKNIYLIADGKPVNFLYFGIPSEVMDLVFIQLLKVTAGFCQKIRAGEKLPAAVLGVDKEIDENVNLREKDRFIPEKKTVYIYEEKSVEKDQEPGEEKTEQDKKVKEHTKKHSDKKKSSLNDIFNNLEKINF